MSSTELELWASSGAMWLTGRPDGPPLASPGQPATSLLGNLDRFTTATIERIGFAPTVPGVELLGERAAHSGYGRSGPFSCGGSFRALAALDGHVGFSLSRPYDIDVLPALTSRNDAAGWGDLESWTRTRTVQEVAERGRLLDMAVAPIPQTSAVRRAPVVVADGARRPMPDVPKVVDLTSLWAGPVCAHLLGLAGADVTKVESVSRPDGTRAGIPSFFDALHRRSQALQLDLSDPEDLARLQDLIAGADLVLEASRPRAMAALGILAEDVVAAGTSWLSITAHGRDTNTVGFGDDIAAGAGLFVVDGDDVLPCGDALADPMAGTAAAAAAAEALLLPHAVLMDVSMHDVVAHAADRPAEPHRIRLRNSTWWVESDAGTFPVRPPRRRRC